MPATVDKQADPSAAESCGAVWSRGRAAEGAAQAPPGSVRYAPASGAFVGAAALMASQRVAHIVPLGRASVNQCPRGIRRAALTRLREPPMIQRTCSLRPDHNFDCLVYAGVLHCSRGALPVRGVRDGPECPGPAG